MGREAVVLLIRYAFDHLNLEKVFAYVRADHPAKETWIETGAVSEGVLKNHFYSEGEFRDVHVLSWFKGCLRK
jgi:RimJ/RimL family protein N-acetyltransferase